MKITKQDLNKISELAKDFYRNDGNVELNDSQLVSAAWTKAVCGVLVKDLVLEFPSRVLDSVFED